MYSQVFLRKFATFFPFASNNFQKTHVKNFAFIKYLETKNSYLIFLINVFTNQRLSLSENFILPKNGISDKHYNYRTLTIDSSFFLVKFNKIESKKK
jgi:hypothetical protein